MPSLLSSPCLLLESPRHSRPQVRRQAVRPLRIGQQGRWKGNSGRGRAATRAQAAGAENSAAAVESVPISAKGRAIVSGAGPAGATAAIFLARHGFKVDIFERRPEPRQDTVDQKRSYIIALTGRGLSALEDAGVRFDQALSLDYVGSVTHPFKGKDRVGTTEGSRSCERIELAQNCISEAQRLYPYLITFHFEQPLQSLDLLRNVATFAAPPGDKQAPPTQVQYDLLVGADGASSVTRRELARQGVMQVQEEDAGREYKTWRALEAPPNFEPPEFERRTPGRTLHLWLSNNSLTSLSAHRNADGRYSGTVALKNGGFDDLTTPEAVAEVLRTQLRCVPEAWLRPIGEQVVDEKALSTGKRVRCSQLHGPKVVLIGDAAHAVTPVGGQGANAALEDCAALGKMLSTTGLEALPERWTRERGPEAAALIAIESSFYKLVGGRKLGFMDPGFLRIIVHVALGTVLNKLLPWFFEPPALTQLGNRYSYSKIVRRMDRDFRGAVVGFACLLAYCGAKVVGVV